MAQRISRKTHEFIPKTMKDTFRLRGLNKKGKTGVYATVEYGKEDWFHSDFDESVISIERQYALFDMFKNGDDNIWKGNHKVMVEFDGRSSGGKPINPVIKKIHLDI